MRYRSIASHLKPYIIAQKRRTTINHAFAAAIAPADTFDEERVRAAISTLGQDPNDELFCVYCGQLAETWDHVFATVLASEFSGYGHRIGNLLPCCKPCNSKKGNKGWAEYLDSMRPNAEREERRQIIQNFLEAWARRDEEVSDSPELHEFKQIKQKVLQLLGDADKLAALIRSR